MTAPAIQSIQYTGTTLYIIFDRAVSGVSDLSAFTFTVTPGPSVITPSFASIDENAVIGTLAVPIGVGETLTVDYTDPGAGVTQVVEAVAPNDPAASFSGQVAVSYYSQPLVRRAVAAPGGVTNDLVTIYFSEPVSATDGDLLNGISIEHNDVALDLSSATATLSDDQTELTIDTGVNPQYSDVVDVIYASGTLYTWGSGAVADFTLNAIDNESTDGLPNSAYPLSFVTKKALTISGNAVTAVLEIDLNPVDQILVSKYGPAEVYTGGTFGVTVGNPAGIDYVGGQAPFVSGTELEATFTSDVNVSYATDAAADWQDVVTNKISIVLGGYRTIDQSITLADDTVEAV